MSLFEKGRAKTGGRAKGARNKLSQAFLEAFAADFEEHGAEVIRIVRMEKPHEYLKTAAYRRKNLRSPKPTLWKSQTMSLMHSLNSPDSDLPSVLSALQSEKQRRLTEDRLK